uniref:Uncharacterized protein n=1 Tax=Anopheles merus TaxID=30066 RepID=A0A182VHF4_ANOME
MIRGAAAVRDLFVARGAAYMTHIYSGVLATIICYASLWRTDRMKCTYIEGIQGSNVKINDRYYKFRNMQIPIKMLDTFLESLQRQSTPSVMLKGEKNPTNKVYPLNRRPYVQEHELISGERLTYMFVIHENVAKLAEFINGAYSTQIIAIVTLFKSASLLHKLLQYKSNYFIDDQALFERSKAIALQLLHRKRFSLFDGSGLFRLDFTFIFST